MKRRLLSFVLVLCMLLAMVPALVPGVSAEEPEEEYIVEEPAELEPEEEIDAIADEPVVEPLDGDGSTVVASGYCGGTADGRYGVVTWVLTSDGTLTISGDGDYGIMKDYSTTTTSEGYIKSTAPWMEYESSLKTLVIESGVRSIGTWAFAGCSGLAGNLVIPDSVASIGCGAFSACSGFTGKLVIPNNVKYIEQAAFFNCSGFTGELVIPSSVTSIDVEAFAYCSGLTGDLVIPASVKGIGSSAFYGCTGLSGNVFFAGNAPTISGDAASDYPTFDLGVTLYYVDGTTGWTDSDAYDADAGTWNGYKLETWDGTGKATVLAHGYCGGEGDGTNLTWTLTDDGTLTISGTGAMEDYEYYDRFNGTFAPWVGYRSGMTALVLEDGITTIGSHAFDECSGFTGDLVIPDSVTNIGEYAFYSCSSFTGNLVIGDSVTSIGSVAFCGCSGFTGNLVIPDSVTSIGGSAFNHCSGFTGDLVIPDSVISIGGSAFNHCSGFTGDLVIPDSVISMGSAFYECSGFTGDLVIGDGVTSIGDEAFYGCSGFTGDLVIGDSVASIGWDTFYGCSGFTSNLVIPDSVTSIGGRAFYNCSGFFGSLVIPDSVTSIGNSAFYGCSGFTGDLVIGDSVTSIEESTFNGCSGFNGSLVIGDSVTSIGSSAFEFCKGFTGDLVIPDSVISIGSSAFEFCKGFTGNLVIPDSVTSIGKRAFYDCSGFTGDLVIPDSVTIIEESTFESCRGFNGELKLPNSLVNIKNSAFNGCSGLTGNLMIPATVKNIGNNAFAGCKGLSGRVYFDGNAPAVVAASNSNASFTSGTTLLYIPDTTGWTESSAYDADAGTWNGYKLLTWDGETTEEYTHSLLTHIPAKAATCTEVGNIEYWYCSGCGKYFSDEAATAEITLADTVTPALGHDYREGSCARCGEPDADWNPNAPKLAVCSTVGRIGKTVEVQVNIANNPGLTGMVTMVTFDSNVLEYVSCQVAEQFVGMSDSYLDGSTLKTVWVTDDEAVVADGTFLTMVFNVKEDAPDGDTYIYLDYEYKNTIDENDERVELVTENGTVTVVAGFLGDINDDGDITIVDARWLLQYLSGSRELTEKQLLLADVNGDGDVTTVDARWMLQRLSGARDENFQAR